MTTTTRTPGPAGPGEATIAELAAHWGVEKRAVAAIARRLGLRKRGSKYPLVRDLGGRAARAAPSVAVGDR